MKKKKLDGDALGRITWTVLILFILTVSYFRPLKSVSLPLTFVALALYAVVLSFRLPQPTNRRRWLRKSLFLFTIAATFGVAWVALHSLMSEGWLKTLAVSTLSYAVFVYFVLYLLNGGLVIMIHPWLKVRDEAVETYAIKGFTKAALWLLVAMATLFWVFLLSQVAVVQ